MSNWNLKNTFDIKPAIAGIKNGKIGRKFFAEVVFVILGVAVVSYILLSWAVGPIIHSRKEQIVPDIKNKSVMAALDELSVKNLALKKEGTEFDDSLPVGSIIRQIPSAGAAVREGKIVRVWVSQGGETVLAPNLVGLLVRNAEVLLRQNQLLLGEVSEAYSLLHPKGFVMRQYPSADSNLSKNAMVNLTVSNGTPPEGIVLMPDFAQKHISAAQKWEAEHGVSLNIREDDDSLFPPGTVIDQKPEPDVLVTRNTQVEITVSGKKNNSFGADRTHKIKYEVPRGPGKSNVKITIFDQNGDREVFNGFREPGTKIDLALPYSGPAKIKIFLNGVLVEERESA